MNISIYMDYVPIAKLIRLLYHLPMERMMDNETFDEVLNSFKEADSIVKRLKTRIAELEEENETLRDTNGDLQRWLKQTEDMLKFQQEENKKLREENEVLKEYKSMYEWLC